MSFIIAHLTTAQYYQMPVYTSTTLEAAQNGYAISKLIDNDPSTYYHSSQVNITANQLDFYFVKSVQSIKKIVYTPRQDGIATGRWTQLNVSYSTQLQPDVFIPIQSDIVFANDATDKTIVLPQAIASPHTVRINVTNLIGSRSSGAELKFYSEVPKLEPVSCILPVDQLQKDDFLTAKIPILANGSTVSSFQPGEEVDKLFDGDLTKAYHSKYYVNNLPITLNLKFDGTAAIDYMRLYPRLGNVNGRLGQVSISYNTIQNANYQNLMNYDFGQSGTVQDLKFPISITPLNIKIIINSGQGNFASAGEIEFYGAAYNTIFDGALYNKLKPTVTQNDIDNISVPFFKTLAQCIFDGKYSSDRTKSYDVYPVRATINSVYKINGRNAFENPTGIIFKINEKNIVVVEGATKPLVIELRTFADNNLDASTFYTVYNGVNILQTNRTGLAYLQYYDDDSTLPDVKMNVITGVVNGIFDLSKNNSDYKDLISNDNGFSQIDVVGKNIHIITHKAALKNYNPFGGRELVNQYEEIVDRQNFQMGLYKYNKMIKNKMGAYFRPYSGSPNAGTIGVNANSDYAATLNPATTSTWMLTHEFGHNNQIRPDIKSHGFTEVTNNIYALFGTRNLTNRETPHVATEIENWYPVESDITIPKLSGSRYNNAIIKKAILQRPLFEDNYQDFSLLVPFNQLLIYYSDAGALRGAPTLEYAYKNKTNPNAGYHTDGVDYANWYATIAEKARNQNLTLSNGGYLMNLVKMITDAVQEDLTEFFTTTGFLRPMDISVNDYGFGQITVTQSMIDEVVAYINSKNYKKPVSPVMHYLSSYSKDAFKNHSNIIGTTGVGVTYNNQFLIVDHNDWKNVVAYETYDKNNELFYVTISGTGNRLNTYTQVYYPEKSSKVLAVAYDGSRKLVYPTQTTLSTQNTILKDDGFNIYPNPIFSDSDIIISTKNLNDIYNFTVYDVSGKLLLQTSGNANQLQAYANVNLKNLTKGTYIVNVKNEKMQFTKKIIRQ